MRINLVCCALQFTNLSHNSKTKHMRFIMFIFLLSLGLSSAGTKNGVTQPGKLNGTWAPYRQEMGGKSLPKKVFERERLIINDSTYTVIAESVDKGIVKFSNGRMDIYGTEGVNKGKHFTAIYKYENDELKICYNLIGNGYPDAFETTGKPAFFLSAFKREK
ncbi:MAG: hypothetical protein JWR02_2501 [Mucilaginibacter sp.]|nr:hypothetical protein [Mucilaginibacter sp.]